MFLYKNLIKLLLQDEKLLNSTYICGIIEMVQAFIKLYLTAINLYATYKIY